MAASAPRRTWRACCSIRRLGIKPTLVAYRGTGPAMNDLVGGHVDFFCEQSVSVAEQITAGTIKGYCGVSASEPLDGAAGCAGREGRRRSITT